MWRRLNTQLTPEQESKLLLGVAVGAGCLLIICLLACALAVGLALLWTLQGQLGPGGALPPLPAGLAVQLALVG